MSGVIDGNGQQWEHCNGCGAFIKIQHLGYLKPTDRLNCGADLCIGCTNTLLACGLVEEQGIQPAAGWIPVREAA